MLQLSSPLQKSTSPADPNSSFPIAPKSYKLTIMLVGTGIDVVEIERIAHSIERYGARFLERIFTADEIAYCQRRKNCAESFAARFAAKEAGAKALGTGIQHGVTWTELEVRRAPGQRPALHFSGRALEIAERLGVKRVSLSLTHGKSVAIATVMLEDQPLTPNR
jgi:holo-[acyl-carrier protein] synthase